MMPNPFYQIYEGAAFLSGAEPYFYNTVKENNYLPDFDAIDESVWRTLPDHLYLHPRQSNRQCHQQTTADQTDRSGKKI